MTPRWAHWGAALAVAAAATASASVRADVPVSPWIDAADVGPPSWAESVVPKPNEGGGPGTMDLFVAPNRGSGKRGVTVSGVSLPYFGSRRGPGCTDRFWLVGPLAWTCADDATLSPAAPTAVVLSTPENGLSASYYFVKSRGTDAFDSIDAAEDGAPNSEVEGGSGVAIVEQKSVHAEGDADGIERWGRTSHGLWLPMRDLEPAHASTFQGEPLTDGRVDFAWVVADRAKVWPTAIAKGKSVGQRLRFARVPVLEASGTMVRVEDGAWMEARDLALPNLSAPPPEVTGPTTHWIDVDLATQTLIAYEGTRALYATLVSTGRGAAGTSNATPVGVHRVWVKILASDMGNAARDDEEHYSLEDVPYVQFFDGPVGLHGTYWHGDFGRVRSHGCVNMAPIDARWMFAFTGPRLPRGWAAAYPMAFDEGTVVRVR